MIYYLTEMNSTKLENVLLKFILHHRVDQKITNGIMGKIATMMYNQHIDYYYADSLASELNVPIHHIDNIYLNGYNKCYNKSLKELFINSPVDTPATIIENAEDLEDAVGEILKTRKPIKTRKPQR